MYMRLSLAATLMAVSMTSVLAQTPMRVAGTVASYSDSILTVKNSTGDNIAVTLAPDVKIVTIENRQLTDIKSGDFVGAAAMKGKDGKLHGQVIRIFTEGMRGTGEGSRPMGEPNQSMTNATVATVAADPTAHTLRLTYKGGEQLIQVDPETKILAFVDGDPSLLKPGAAVSVYASKASDGKLSAKFVQAEKNGVKP
jgi:hypothetical protein